MTDDAFQFWQCSNIAPGVCCQTPYTIEGFPHVMVFHLTALDIAAIWEPRDDNYVWPRIGGCFGRIRASRAGPGTWNWIAQRSLRSGALQSFAAGASYITLPASLPPDQTTINALSIQGILGLAWGGGKWFASGAAKQYLEGRSHPMRRDIRSGEKGDVLARSPQRIAYPDHMKINGTEYESDRGAGNLIYRIKGTAQTRNLTELFMQRG
ncbi:MAG: hypothetical protein LQ338_006792 [Usnochroma carphineum]|nr:MAG: hypothetical protein LQ338_006792 [Usnochroma carphineum]